jgi:hypothetical protein
MFRKFWHLAALSLVVTGCSPSNEISPNHSANAGTKNAPLSGTAQDTPDQAVFDFLEAVRTGNDQQAAAMLTPAARQKTAEMQMVVAPPGSPTARFKVGQVEYVTPDKDGAHVWCTWTDVVDAEGHTRSDDIIWVLRHETEGWRIAGMVTKIYADQPPLILNFEDPEDMLRKQQLLHEGASGNESAAHSNGSPEAKHAEQAPPLTR